MSCRCLCLKALSVSACTSKASSHVSYVMSLQLHDAASAQLSNTGLDAKKMDATRNWLPQASIHWQPVMPWKRDRLCKISHQDRQEHVHQAQWPAEPSDGQSSSVNCLVAGTRRAIPVQQAKHDAGTPIHNDPKCGRCARNMQLHASMTHTSPS